MRKAKQSNYLKVALSAAFLASLAILLSCGSEMVRRLDVKPLPQPMVFQQSFINNAWGYQNRGWFIDGAGAVLAYSARDGSLWKPVERSGPDSGYISRENLQANTEFKYSLVYNIPLLELNKYYKLLEKASTGDISERKRGAYDAGLVQYTGYIWDDNKGKFKAVLISLSGDWLQANTDSSAIAIREYLDAINTFYADSIRVWQP